MTLTNEQVTDSLKLFRITDTKRVPVAILRKQLPTVEHALFFAKLYKLDRAQLAELINELFHSTVIEALTAHGGAHSNELQSYIVETVPEAVNLVFAPKSKDKVPDTELLGALFEQANVEIATSIQKVADKLARTLDALPSKTGEMVFDHLLKFQVQRGQLGASFEPGFKHRRDAKKNLVVFDVSGSMSAATVHAIANEVVGLAYKADASLAIVSNSCYFWEAGTFKTADILDKAEYGGTHYETLAPLFTAEHEWGVVVTIADYDSSYSAKETLASGQAKIGQVLDISLVNQPTFLAECVGHMANEVKPLITGNSGYVLS